MISYLILVAACLVLVRIIIGPTFADRVIAVDALVYLAVFWMAFLAIKAQTPLYLDIGLVLAMLSFIGTIAIAKYVVVK
jgi:multicomponent Na+:H+ antiporter subunit F